MLKPLRISRILRQLVYASAMGYGEHRISEILIYAIAFSLAVAIALAPQKAWSGPYEAGATPPPGPRWSNDHHIIDSVTVGTGWLRSTSAGPTR